ncbi:hypothetical protein [Ralstonia sp. 1138]|uniref:hypothetical protein n=1 Tax=Ralstonia sp. 1138 TaxID=3156423 RepID=UPI003391B93B
MTDADHIVNPSMPDSFHLIAIYAEAEMQSIARQYVPDCAVAALELALAGPWFLIKTTTDAERDLLQRDPTLLNAFKAVFRARACPEALVERLTFTFQSLETVERDYAGNWYWALK